MLQSTSPLVLAMMVWTNCSVLRAQHRQLCLLQRYFAKYEFTIPHLMCASDCEAVQMSELLEGADADLLKMYVTDTELFRLLKILVSAATTGGESTGPISCLPDFA